MTCIVSPAIFKSKKALQEAANSPKGLRISDPSIFNPKHGPEFNTRDMGVGEKVVVTNHPLRSKFATITRTADGFKVS